MNHIHFINRRNTDCYKWDSVKNNADFVPLWVADMDIATPEPIVKTIVNRAQHPAYGYVKVPKRYYDAVTQWFDTQHGWKFNNDDIIYTTGVIPAVSAVIKAVTKPGDNVILFTPVYNHFYSSIKNNNCKMVSCPLIADENNVYHIDFEAFENICKTQGGILLLCNPHNPTSRVFSPEELDKIVQICLKYNIFVISDEIHCEIVMPGFEYTPFGKIADKYPLKYAVCNSPSKTFNTASLQIANIICKDSEIRAKIDRAININECCDVNPFGFEALITGYTDAECKEYIKQLNQTIFNHYEMAKQLLETQTSVKITPLEGTYLMWIKCSEIGRKAFEMEKELITKYKVWLNPGTLYGEEGEGYMRINLATSPELLKEGISRFINYYKDLVK